MYEDVQEMDRWIKCLHGDEVYRDGETNLIMSEMSGPDEGYAQSEVEKRKL